MTPQPSRPTASGRAAGSTGVHCPAATSVCSAKAPMPERRAQLGAVGEGHLLGGVVGGEAVLGLAPPAGPAVAADGPPVEDDEVAGGHVGDAVADGLDDARRLVAEQVGELVADRALAVVEVGVADPAGLDADEGLAGSGVGDDDRGLDLDRCAGGRGRRRLDLVGHRRSPGRRARGCPDASPAASRPEPGTTRSPSGESVVEWAAMKKLLVLIVVVALAAFAVKKLQDA